MTAVAAPKDDVDPRSIDRLKIAVAVLFGLPLVQLAFERMLSLPIGPTRMLTIGLCALALVPVAVALLERLSGAALSRGARLATAIVVPLLAIAHLMALVRLADGPFGPVPGGPFHAASVPAPLDWSGAEALRYAELEVDSARPRTLETLVLVHGEGLYVAANMPEGKRWPRVVREEGHVRIRLGDDAVYALAARYVESPERTHELAAALAGKYGFDASMGGPIWFFALERAPR